MYWPMFIRVNKIEAYEYLYLVENALIVRNGSMSSMISPSLPPVFQELPRADARA
jgi:hypothetical protein